MRIGVLIHVRDTLFSQGERWLLQFILAAARERGHSVHVLRGVGANPPLDVLIPHVDLTVRPPQYERFLSRHGCVLNLRLRDISKRALGCRALGPGEDFEGPVMLKSDLNFGGRPELRLIPGRRWHSEVMHRLRHLPLCRRWAEAAFWRWTPCLSSRDYRVYPSLREVPPQAFRNPRLVVQPFEPEEQDGLFALRKWTFLGDAGSCTRSLGTGPIVKAANRVPGSITAAPVPDEVREFRRKIGMDFGKIDFVVREGRAVILDVNPTPSVSTEGGSRGAARRAPLLAEALERWVAC